MTKGGVWALKSWCGDGLAIWDLKPLLLGMVVIVVAGYGLIAPPTLGQEAQPVEHVIDITRPDFNGGTFGFESYFYQGSAGLAEVMSADFADRFRVGLSDRHVFSMIHDTFWIRVQFKNPLAESRKIYLFDTMNFATEIAAYHDKQLLGKLTSSDALRQRVITLEIGPNSIATYYIKRLAHGNQVQSWTYWSDQIALTHRIHNREAELLPILAIFVMSFLINGIFFYAFRSREYIHYMSYLIGTGILTAGYWSYYGVEHMATVQFLCAAVATAAGLLFTIHFVGIDAKFPIWRKVLYGLAWACFATIATIPFKPLLSSFLFINLTGISSVLCFILAFYVYCQSRGPHVLLYLFAYGSMLIATALQMVIWQGFLPDLAHIDSAAFLGFAVENILMLLAMGYKIKLTEELRQTGYLELNHNYNQMKKVFYPHQIDLIRQGYAVEDTMPTGTAEACVMAFDMISSSKITDERFPDVFESFMEFCRLKLMQGYQDEPLKSSGYMIKELGDGFLCAVGFPFATLGGSQEACAVGLAFEMIAAFETIVSNPLGGKLHCAIGIAKGEVEGYFSSSGRMRDDLRGRAIILATRYESMRKQLVHVVDSKETCMIILQEEVYASLPADGKRHFRLLHLNDHNLKVRDHAEAEALALWTSRAGTAANDLRGAS